MKHTARLLAIFLLLFNATAAEEALPRTPAVAADKAAQTFEVLHGFKMELLAAEPLVTDPVALAYDEDGRAYVCEMNDYPYTDKAKHKKSQENPTDQPIGKVRLLVDTDGDGRFERSTIFADKLSWPTGIACWKGGVFVTATPDLWYFKDTDGDGVADVREKIFVGFRKMNVQAVINNLAWGPDNRLYAAGSTNGGEIRPGARPDGKPIVVMRSNDFRFDPNDPEGTLTLLAGGARFGNTFDDEGHRFICNIRNPVMQPVLPNHYLARNPHAPVRTTISEVAQSGVNLAVYRISPDEPWRAMRARLWAGERNNLNPASELIASGVVTSASGICVYRGAAYPKDFYGNIFLAESASNLFYRQQLTPDGVSFKARRVDGQKEFVASRDLWFRPVNLINAPDGMLHVCDMYREVIEHPWSIPDDIHALIDLESGRDRGRLWRLAPPDFTPPKPPRLSKATSAELVAALENPNSWWRETAQRLLVERQDVAAVAPLRGLLANSKDGRARLHALWTLDGLRVLSHDDLLLALQDDTAAVRRHGVRLAEAHLGAIAPLRERVIALCADADIGVRFQVALTLGELKGELKNATVAEALAAIARKDAADPWMNAAVLSSVADSSDQLLAALLADGAFAASIPAQELLRQLAFVAGARNRAPEVARVVAALPDENSPVTRQIAVGLGDGLKRAGRNLRTIAATAPKVDAVLSAAQQTAMNETAASIERVQAVALLAFDEFPRSEPALAKLLDPRLPHEIQSAAVQALSGFSQPEVAPILLKRWKTYSPAVRAEAVQALLTLKNRILPLFDAIEAEKVAANQIPPARRKLLLEHNDPEIQKRALKIFGDGAERPRKEVIDKYQAALKLNGDVARGKLVAQTACVTCHKIGDKGHDVGPNLGTVRQWTTEQLLTNILDPNREVAPNFLDYVVELKDGQTLSGLIADETPAGVTLRRPEGVQQDVLRQNIAKITSTGLSLMPEGLEATISIEQMADLLAYLRAQ